jgi:hypothetical protein
VWAEQYLRDLHFVPILVENTDSENKPQFKAFAGVKTFLEPVDFAQAGMTLAIRGDADEGSDRIAHAKEAVGQTHDWLYADFGGLPREEGWASLRRGAEKMLPQFR